MPADSGYRRGEAWPDPVPSPRISWFDLQLEPEIDTPRVIMKRALVRASKLGFILLLSQTLIVRAAEIKVIASNGVANVVTELVHQFEAKTGHKAQTDFAVIAVSKKKIDAGANFDIAILGPSAIDELIQQGKIIANTKTGFGRTGLAVLARKDDAKPDISSTEAFKRAMLEAKSVGHSKQGLSGVYFLAILDRLKIAEEMKAKLKTYDGVGLVQAVATQEVELGVSGLGTVVANPLVEFVGPFPKEIQAYVEFTAGIATSAKDLAASKALLQFMTAPDTAQVFKSKGMDRDE
jgi:molybdate transport system substrate-binding protein